MKILSTNKFFYKKGGSELIFFEEAELLQTDHNIAFFAMNDEKNIESIWQKYFASNIDYSSKKLGTKINNIFKIMYSFEAKRKATQLIDDFNPDIAHLHNIYHQLSPSIIHALKNRKIPIVMTLHDLKLVCASYLMLLHGQICESCKNGTYYHCFLKGCVKNSKLKSLLGTLEMYLHHKILHIYDYVDIFIAPSMFLKTKLESMGFNRNIVHLFNFINLDNFDPSYNHQDRSIVYFGRLSKEKGITTLINAVADLDVKLKIIGDGPLKEQITQKINTNNIANISLLGFKSGEELKNEIRNSMFVVTPSECYENNPCSIIESFALGKPVIGSNIGGIPEMVINHHTGLTFTPGNIEKLKENIQFLLDNPNKVVEYGKNARQFAERELSSKTHYQKLIDIYQQAISKNNQKK